MEEIKKKKMKDYDKDKKVVIEYQNFIMEVKKIFSLDQIYLKMNVNI